MDNYFLLSPIFSFLLAGSIKFILNSLMSKNIAFSKIGLGGFPSTHNAITSSAFFSILLHEKSNSPLLLVALSLMLIVAIDSLDLRNKIEKHAEAINSLSEKKGLSFNLRTKIGHKPYEVFGGILVGLLVSYVLFFIGN